LASAVIQCTSTLVSRQGVPSWRNGRVMRPAACSAFHGLHHGRVSASRRAKVAAVTVAWMSVRVVVIVLAPWQWTRKVGSFTVV
jgi:hypothetical protein